MNRHNLIASLMVCCAMLVAAWMFLAHYSRRPYEPFDLASADFAAFQPETEGWKIRKLPIANQSAVDANIVALSCGGPQTSDHRPKCRLNHRAQRARMKRGTVLQPLVALVTFVVKPILLFPPPIRYRCSCGG